MAKRSAPEVNAGSMADIAFLLLIFFLVTTTIESDTGMTRRLPPKLPDDIQAPKIKEKNLFTIVVNKNNDLLVEEQPMELKDLREATIAFLDNGGAKKGNENNTKFCAYCKGKRNPESSDNPEKAVVSLQNSRETNYASYIAITNEVLGAYKFLRNREANRLYGMSYSEIVQQYKDSPDETPEKEAWKVKRDEVKKLFPEKFSEAESKDS